MQHPQNVVKVHWHYIILNCFVLTLQNRSQILRLLTSINTSEDGEAEVCGVRLQVPVPRSPIRGCSEDHLPPLQQGPLLILLRFKQEIFFKSQLIFFDFLDNSVSISRWNKVRDFECRSLLQHHFMVATKLR